MEEISRRGWLIGLAGVAGAAVTGCTQPPQGIPVVSPSDQPSESPTPSPSPTPTPTPVLDTTTKRWPLTGVPFKDGDEAKAAHAVVGVKLAVEMASFPQTGVEDADLVFVESQGDSYDATRLCAIFHSVWPKDGANAVRSARPVDLALMAPLKGTLASTGADPWVVKYLKDNSKLVQLRERLGDSSGRWKSSRQTKWWLGGLMTYKSVIAMPSVMSADASLGKGVVPPVYLQYPAPGAPHSAVGGKSAKQVTATYSLKLSGYPTAEHHRWDWDAKSGTWLASIRFPKQTARSSQPAWKAWTARSGKRVSATNVLILYCPWKMGVLKGYSGHNEPIYSIIDGGDKFVYFSGGSYVTGTWKKGAVADRFEFTLDDGTPLVMAPGKTWVEMPKPADAVEIK